MPEKLEAFFQQKLLEASDFPIIAVQKNARNNFATYNLSTEECILCKKNNWDSIIAQTKIGLAKIRELNPDAYVFLAEHDVLYPEEYFNIPLKRNIIYKNLNWYFTTNRGWFFGGSWIHSNTIAHIDVWDYCVNEPSSIRFKDKHSIHYTHKDIFNTTPVLDIRWGKNYTGDRGQKKSPLLSIPYYGKFDVFWKQIEILL